MRVNRVLQSLAFSILFFSLVPWVVAQEGLFRGVVTDEEGNRIPKAEIEIVGLDGKRQYKTKTNKKGQFIYLGVWIQANYRVIARKEGYQPDYVEGVRPGRGFDDRERGEVNLVLKKGGDGRLFFELSEEELAANAAARAEEATEATISQAVERGEQFLKKRQYEKALKSFTNALQVDKNRVEIWVRVGDTHLEMQQYGEALQAYQSAIDLKSEDPKLHRNLVKVYQASGDGEKAKEALDKASVLDYFIQAQEFISAGKNRPAVDALKLILELDPTHVEATYQLGLSLVALHLMEEGLTYLKSYLEMAPNGPNAQTAKALIEELGHPPH